MYCSSLRAAVLSCCCHLCQLTQACMLLMCCLLHKPSSVSLTQPRTPCFSLLVSGVAFRWMQLLLIRFSELQVPDGANVSELRKLGVYYRRLLKNGMEAMLVRLLSSQKMLGLILMMSSSALSLGLVFWLCKSACAFVVTNMSMLPVHTIQRRCTAGRVFPLLSTCVTNHHSLRVWHQYISRQSA